MVEGASAMGDEGISIVRIDRRRETFETHRTPSSPQARRSRLLERLGSGYQMVRRTRHEVIAMSRTAMVTRAGQIPPTVLALMR